MVYHVPMQLIVVRNGDIVAADLRIAMTWQLGRRQVVATDRRVLSQQLQPLRRAQLAGQVQ